MPNNMTEQPKKGNSAGTAGDHVDILVRQAWRTCPGMGIKSLQEYVRRHQPPNKDDVVISKARIKAAKALLPYEYVVPNGEDNRNSDSRSVSYRHDRHDFVVRKIQERQSLRNARRFAEADYIQRGLQAMGVEIDDVHKTWTIRCTQVENKSQRMSSTSVDTAESTIELKNHPPLPQTLSAGVACHMCRHYFASRNLVFQHLRDPTSGCGTQIFAQGLVVPLAPSAQNKEANCKPTTAPGQTARHAPAAHGVWLGDLPLPWTRRQQWIRAILASHLSSLDIPTPWIKKIVRKGYRQTSSCTIGEMPNNNNDQNHQNPKDAYLGYAIVFFRDTTEAVAARQALDGKQVSLENTFWGNPPAHLDMSRMKGFCLKARPVEKSESTKATMAWEFNVNDSMEQQHHDPPLVEQLRPLPLNELRQRLIRLDKSNGDTVQNNVDAAIPTNPSVYATQHQKILDELAPLMLPRPKRYVEGLLLPEQLAQQLLTLLQTIKWPARNERPGLTAQRYFVLPTNAAPTDRFYQDLRQACRKLMDWADPDFYYSGIAVTHNFVASPHIDVKDRNYQYAVALGDFIDGGQLCVETAHGECVDVINTKNRIAKLDGRQVHWVRTWKTGDRYSLIFYDTTIQNHPAPTIPSYKQ